MKNDNADQWMELAERKLEELTEYSSDFCQDVTRSLVAAGGKRIRPRFLLSIASALGFAQESAIAMAAAVELVHNGTLLQDDVIDQSALRRGKPTAFSIWGTGAGVLGGNLLYTRAFESLITNGQHEDALDLIRALHLIVIGEMEQQQQSWRIAPDEEALVHVARYKTGAFFGAMCRHLARAAGGDIEHAHEWGVQLGYGFQLADDLLDFGGKIDKPVAKDLREGYQTLPMYRAGQKNALVRQAITRAIESRAEQDFDAAYDAIRSSSAENDTVEELRSLQQRLLDDLGWLGSHDTSLIKPYIDELIRISFYRSI